MNNDFYCVPYSYYVFKAAETQKFHTKKAPQDFITPESFLHFVFLYYYILQVVIISVSAFMPMPLIIYIASSQLTEKLIEMKGLGACPNTIKIEKNRRTSEPSTCFQLPQFQRPAWLVRVSKNAGIC